MEKSPHDADFNVVIARVLSKSKGTPIRWKYYDQAGGASYNLKEPSVEVWFDKEPRLRWIKSLHTELCTSRLASVWKLHRHADGSSNHSGSISPDDKLFTFKNPDGSVRWTVSVIKKC